MPSVSLSLDPDTVCLSAGGYALTGGLPNGGNYSGAGVSGGNFNPSAAGSGFHVITYAYTDSNNCTNTGTAQLFVDLCTGVNQFSSSGLLFSIFPNPNTGTFSISTNEEAYSLIITTILGEQILSQKTESEESTIDLSNQPNGIYFLYVRTEMGMAVKKIIISR